jgi:signal transduction histidine kinase/ligand-binding sensor domain-containing protein
VGLVCLSNYSRSATCGQARLSLSENGFPEPQVLIGMIRFERISLGEGLSESTVQTILQDSYGFMWFGTEDGLNRYDGYQFAVYDHDPDDPNSLASGDVHTLLEDIYGDIWVGTLEGLERFDRATGTFEHIPYETDSSQDSGWAVVLSIFEDSTGALWVGTGGAGLVRIDPDSGDQTHFRRDPSDPKSLSDDYVWTVYQDHSGNLWVGTFNGLNLFDPVTETFTRYLRDPAGPRSLSHNSVRTIFEDSQGRLWIGTDGGGLDLMDRTSGEFQHLRRDSRNISSLSDNRILAILEDRDGGLWIGTRNGLNYLAPDQGSGFVSYHHDLDDPYSLSDNTVLSLFEDRSGVLWVGTGAGGLSKHNRVADQFGLYQHRPNDPSSLSDNSVNAVFQDQSGTVWIGTRNGGLNRLDIGSGAFETFRNDPDDSANLGGDEVRAILEDSDRTLWIGTRYGGLYRFDATSEAIAPYRHDSEDSATISEDSISVLFEDSQGSLWVGTWNGGLNKWDPDASAFTRFLHDPQDMFSIGSNSVRSILEVSDGRLWVGTSDRGISVLDPTTGRFEHHVHDPRDPQSLSSDDAVLSIQEDEDGSVWVALYGGGINRYDPTTDVFTHYSVQDGLSHDRTYCIQIAPNGELWISTNNGLDRFDPQSEVFRNYGTHDGLQSTEFNYGACYQGNDGRMYFGGPQGLNAFYPEQVTDNLQPPQVVITAIDILNRGAQREIVPGERIELSYRDYLVSFEFAALDYTVPELNQYEYMMVGVDEDWVSAGTRRYASYTNLRGGEYVFRVRGSNNDGVWNQLGAAVHISVEPPFWESWWFRGAAVLAAIGAVFVGYRLRIRGIELRSRSLERQVGERTQEIQRRTQELAALYRADEELYRHLQLDQVSQTLVDLAVDVLKADKSSLLIWDQEEERQVVVAARGLSPQTLAHMSFARGEGIIGRVVVSTLPAVIEDIQTDSRRAEEPPSFIRALDREGIRSFMHIPIKVEGHVFGVFGTFFSEPHAFGRDEQRLFEALAQRAALAIENAQLYGQAQRVAVLTERQRLARELHDAVTQTLFSASLISEVLPVLWENDAEEGRQMLRELRQLSRGALAEMRSLLLELRPSTLTEASLGDLLRQLAEAAGGRTGVPVQVSVDDRCDMPPEVQVALYRIAQEALNNVVKHSRAGQVEISLRNVCQDDGDRIELSVFDDGCGFDPSCVPPNHMGLVIMHERAKAIGAVLSVESEIESGTRVLVVWREQ